MPFERAGRNGRPLRSGPTLFALIRRPPQCRRVGNLIERGALPGAFCALISPGRRLIRCGLSQSGGSNMHAVKHRASELESGARLRWTANVQALRTGPQLPGTGGSLLEATNFLEVTGFLELLWIRFVELLRVARFASECSLRGASNHAHSDSAPRHLCHPQGCSPWSKQHDPKQLKREIGQVPRSEPHLLILLLRIPTPSKKDLFPAIDAICFHPRLACEAEFPLLGPQLE